MWLTRTIGTIALLLAALSAPARSETPAYAWHPAAVDMAHTLRARFAPPPGFERQPAAPGSFAAWLRGLPLKPAGTSVLLHTGKPKWRQDVHAAVVDIDTGTRDLQQCADAVMRLRAEWQFATGHRAAIAFNDTGGGKPMAYTRWAAGERPRASGHALVWSRSARPDASYASFRRYMDTVFVWAGTHSLSRELVAVTHGPVETGDVIIKGGFPGHAVLVADTVVDPKSGARRHLLIQSFMPAQDMHVLKNPDAADGSPWYRIDVAGPLRTPEWSFPAGSVRRWRSKS